jgi:hypothetical protein
MLIDFENSVIDDLSMDEIMTEDRAVGLLLEELQDHRYRSDGEYNDILIFI